MYLFLSRDKKKLCVRPSINTKSDKLIVKIIPNSWKKEIFGNLWSIRIEDLSDKYRNIPEIKELLNSVKLQEESVISKPEFVGTCFCENCGILLNESGTCPICDDGEEDYY